jgi:hypothetical protein
MAWIDTSWFVESMAAIREKGNFITVPLYFKVGPVLSILKTAKYVSEEQSPQKSW